MSDETQGREEPFILITIDEFNEPTVATNLPFELMVAALSVIQFKSSLEFIRHTSQARGEAMVKKPQIVRATTLQNLKQE